MEVGLQYPILLATIDDDAVARRFDEFCTDVVWADESGFDGVWITEHHFSNYSLTSWPLGLLATAAQIAPRLRVGTAILVLPLWDPARLVAEVSTLDVLSKGRVELGIGRGYQPHEFRGFGQDPERSRERFEEAVELILQLFREEDTTFAGEHFNVPVPVTTLPRPAQKPYPPIWMAASSPDSIRFAARKGFHFMTPTTWTTPELAVQREFIELCMAEADHPAEGRQFEANRFVFCSSDERKVRRAIEESAWQTVLSKELLQGAAPVRGINPIPDRDTSVDAVMHDRLIAGTPDQIVAQFQALADAGITYVLGQFRFGDLPGDVAMESMQRFAEDVLPRVRELVPRPLVSRDVVKARS
jgi:alkanesulfonate monooxygenase SsuD/methylene tetrahydromethanopterin reductase-like flavin-dependent oxidoreductase (luciferase family)